MDLGGVLGSLAHHSGVGLCLLGGGFCLGGLVRHLCCVGRLVSPKYERTLLSCAGGVGVRVVDVVCVGVFDFESKNKRLQNWRQNPGGCI